MDENQQRQKRNETKPNWIQNHFQFLPQVPKFMPQKLLNSRFIFVLFCVFEILPVFDFQMRWRYFNYRFCTQIWGNNREFLMRVLDFQFSTLVSRSFMLMIYSWKRC